MKLARELNLRVLIAVVALGLGQASHAQGNDAAGRPPVSGRPAAPEGWTLTLGVGPVLSPAWQGSRDTTLSLFPDLRINYGDTFFASVPEGIGLNAVNQDGWRAGPVVKIRFGRKESSGGSPFIIAGGSDALRGLGNVGAAAEVGGFVEKRLGARREWRVRSEVRRGFGGHEGVVAEGSIAYQLRAGRAIINIGPRATIVSGDYMQTYFGIDAGQSLRSGISPYDAKGGLLSYGVGSSLIRPLDSRSAITVFAALDRLGDEAAKSSLVRERGRKTQFTIGMAYGFRFNL